MENIGPLLEDYNKGRHYNLRRCYICLLWKKPENLITKEVIAYQPNGSPVLVEVSECKIECPLNYIDPDGIHLFN